MKRSMYSLLDEKSLVYSPPVLFDNDEVAVRALRREAQEPNTMLSTNPEDFRLYYVGTFNDAMGTIEPDDHRLVLDLKTIGVRENE